jgi:VWFA-related protein
MRLNGQSGATRKMRMLGGGVLPLIMLACCFGIGGAATELRAQARIIVTVMDDRTGQPVTDLKASEFTVLDDKRPRAVQSAEYSTEGLMDVMLLVDSSLVGEAVRAFAANLIEQLQPKEQMALVSFHSSADLLQDFTSSKESLRRALDTVKYGNMPQVLDGVYATIDGGFQHSAFRRVLFLLTAGIEGGSRVREATVVKLARRNGVSIYPVYLAGFDRDLFRNLAAQTGGASFHIGQMRKRISGEPGPFVMQVARGRYMLEVAGNLSLGERVKVEISRKGKYFVSALPLE